MIKPMITVVKEQIRNFYLIQRLSVFEVRSANSNHYLGILWEVIKPLIMIAIYAIVFGAGIRNGRPLAGGIDFLPWLLAGIVIWFFFSPGITKGSSSVYSRAELISKMNFPMSAIPAYVILSKLYAHLFLVVIIFLFLWVWGFPPTIYLIQLPYYTLATILMLIAICLVTSTLTTIVRDIQMFITSTTRMLLYLAPILWDPMSSNLPTWVVLVMKMNPVYYVVEGYRHALLGESWYFIDHPLYTLYYWVLVLVLFMVGSVLHLKFRNRFVEYI